MIFGELKNHDNVSNDEYIFRYYFKCKQQQQKNKIKKLYYEKFYISNL